MTNDHINPLIASILDGQFNAANPDRGHRLADDLADPHDEAQTIEWVREGVSLGSRMESIAHDALEDAMSKARERMQDEGPDHDDRCPACRGVRWDGVCFECEGDA